jgi:membrane-associated protein
MSVQAEQSTRPRRRGLLLALALASAVVAAVVVTGLITAIDPGRWDLARLGALTYPLAGGMAFLEVGTPLGLIAPSELAVPFAGAAAAAGAVGLLPLIAVVWTCSALGDSAGFLTGRLAGDRLLTRLRRTRPHLVRHHDSLASHFARRGTATVLLGRWLPYARTATPLVAGASGMPYRRLAAASVVGSGVWSTAMCTLGFAAYRSVGAATQWVGRTGLLVLLCLVALLVVRRRLRRRAVTPGIGAVHPTGPAGDAVAASKTSW